MLKKQRQPVNGLFQPHFTVRVSSQFGNENTFPDSKKTHIRYTYREKHFFEYDLARKFFRRVCRMYGIHENDIMHGPGYLATPEIKYEYSVILF